jgi:hypothetical protein
VTKDTSLSALSALRVLFPLIAFSLVGCAGVSWVRYSRAVISDPNAQVSTEFDSNLGEVFVFRDIHFQVSIGNATGSDLVLLPVPVPYPIHKGPSQGSGFLMDVRLKPPTSGAVFDPQEVFMWETPSERHAPSTIIGPYDCNSQKPRPPKRSLPIGPFGLEAGTYTCIWLGFDEAPPDPRDTFFVEIAGLIVDGQSRPLPVIRFEEATSTRSSTIP